MSAFRRLRLPLALRAFVLGLLVLGMMMNPVMAAVCDIEDASQRLAGQDQPVASQEQGAGAGCCQAQVCNACCTHAATMVPALKVAITPVPALTGPQSVLSVEFEPTAYPVPFRPPILG